MNVFGARSKQIGFTLIEAMVTVAILGILVTIAAPSFTDLLRSNRVASATNERVAALSFARSEAIKQRQPIRIVRLDGSWAGRWAARGSDDKDIRVWDSLPNNFSVTGPNGDLTFLPDGRSNTSSSFVISLGDTSRTVSVSATGRIRLAY